MALHILKRSSHLWHVKTRNVNCTTFFNTSTSIQPLNTSTDEISPYLFITKGNDVDIQFGSRGAHAPAWKIWTLQMSKKLEKKRCVHCHTQMVHENFLVKNLSILTRAKKKSNAKCCLQMLHLFFFSAAMHCYPIWDENVASNLYTNMNIY